MKVLQIGIVGALLVLLMSCKTLGAGGKQVDYGAAARQIPTLDVPPDLTLPVANELYNIPQGAGGISTTYSEYSKGGAAQNSSAVLPEIPGVRFERDGAQRWLQISDKPENVWPVVKAFWLENGLIIKSEEPAAGVMETDWAENRAKFSRVGSRYNSDNSFDQAVYSVGERDQYTTRLERGKDGSATEIYIIHRGMEEVFSNDKKVPQWQARGNDPEKEAIMLQRMMVRFGASEKQAANAVAEIKPDAEDNSVTASGVPAISSTEPAGAASLREISESNVVMIINDPFDRSWRKVGLAIDSSGLAVEDKDRDKGIYYLRPVKLERSWWEKMKFWKSIPEEKKQYRVNVKDGGTACEVSVTDQDGSNSVMTKQMIETIHKNINK